MKSLVFILAMTNFFVGQVSAQSKSALLVQIEQLVLDNIQEAQCADGRKCAPASKQERTTYPLPQKASESVFATALRSTAAEACKLDYRALLYLPMMSAARQSGSFSQRQIAFIGLQHGITLGVLSRSGSVTCDEDWRAFFEIE